MSDILELETRRKIYDFISRNPGVNLSEVAKILNLSAQLVDYHLLYMQQHELITIMKELGYKRCYVKGEIGVEDKKILSLLRQEIPLKIILFLIKKPYSKHKDILKHLDMSSPRFSYHLRKLVQNGVIEESDKERGYKVKNVKVIIGLLIRFKPTYISDMARDTWIDFAPG